MSICKYCSKECRNENSRRNHERLCHSNPERQLLPDRLGSKNPHYGKKGSNAVLKASKNGLPKPFHPMKGRSTGPRSKEYCERQSQILRGREGVGGLRHGAGRGKKGYYQGIWCDGTWELAYVIWCLEHDILIRRAQVKLPYEFEGKTHYYYPDFLVGETSLVEIKGYFSKQARVKSETYPEIQVITRDNIAPYLRFAEEKAGSKDLTKLYASIV